MLRSPIGNGQRRAVGDQGGWWHQCRARPGRRGLRRDAARRQRNRARKRYRAGFRHTGSICLGSGGWIGRTASGAGLCNAKSLRHDARRDADAVGVCPQRRCQRCQAGMRFWGTHRSGRSRSAGHGRGAAAIQRWPGIAACLLHRPTPAAKQCASRLSQRIPRGRNGTRA